MSVKFWQFREVSMMRDRILIDKKMIPYSFDIMLGAEWFNMEFHYNARADLFTATLSRDGVVLAYNEPVVYGVAMFTDLYTRGDFPHLEIVPFDESEQEDVVTYANLGETVFLTIKQGDEDEE